MFRQVAVADIRGAVRVRDFGGIRCHVYTSPDDGLLTNTIIVEGPRKLMIFDAQFFLPHAREAAAYAATLAKPVERIILSHVHLDHWSGLGVFAAQFPNAPIYAPEGVADYLRARGQSILDSRRPDLGDRIPELPTLPTHVLSEGAELVDGVRFEFLRFADAESALQLVTIMPDQRMLLAFDLAFAPDNHVFTVTRHFDNWVVILDGLKARQTFDTVLSGHGEAAGRSALEATITYLKEGKRVYQISREADAYAGRMKVTFPQRRNPSWIDLSATLLYGVIDAYETKPGR